MEITCVRHTSVNVPAGLCYGHSDVPLSASFEKEMADVLLNINKRKFDQIFSSPLVRCTALAKQMGSNIIEDERLKELFFGTWEMKKWAEIDDPALDIWMSSYVETPCSGGESFVQLRNRISDFVGDMLKTNKQTPLIVTHGGVIRCFYNIFNNISLEQVFDIHVPFGSVHRFEFLKDKHYLFVKNE